jgi:hypothetical protein
MKSNEIPNPSQVIQETNNQLANEDYESLAKEFNEELLKNNFTVVDMWNRHRNTRSASDTMRKWNLN